MANLLHFNSSNHKILKILSMMAYITKIQNLLIFSSVNLTIMGRVTKLNPVGYQNCLDLVLSEAESRAKQCTRSKLHVNSKLHINRGGTKT